MKSFKKGVRLLFIILFLIAASFGIGIGNALNNNRERYMDNEVRIENTTKKEEEDDEEESKR
jgi:hypothetical protein